MQDKIRLLKRRLPWKEPPIEYTYCPWGASDVAALTSVRRILSNIRIYQTVTVYRMAANELGRIGKCDTISEYAQEAATQACAFMQEYDMLGTLEDGKYKEIPPNNAAALQVKEWSHIGPDGSLIVVTWHTANILIKDRHNVVLPSFVILTKDGTLMGKSEYYRKFKYAVLGIEEKEIGLFNLERQLFLATHSVAILPPDKLKNIVDPEKNTQWLTPQ